MIRDYPMFILCVICGILMMFSSITNFISKRRKYALFSMAFIAMMLLISNKIAHICDGSDNVCVFAKISKFMVYALFLLIIYIFNMYLKDLFLHEGNTEVVPYRLKLVDFVVLAGELTLIISCYTDFYYSYNNNTYQRSNGFIVSYIFPLASMIIQLTAILNNNEKFRKRRLILLVMFIISPICMSMLQFFIHGVSLVTSTIVSMVILLYSFSILDASRVEKLVNAIDAKDPYTKGHSKRVAKYASLIAEKAGKTKEQCDEIYLIGLLHDVGKIEIPDEIINKTSALTEEELAVIKTHPLKGRKILDKISLSPGLSIGAKYHHERFDGKGYPEGLKGEEIPEIARIIAVADTYDAMASKRSYRDVLPQDVVRTEIMNGIATQFDPVFAKIMVELIDNDPEYHMRQQD